MSQVEGEHMEEQLLFIESPLCPIAAEVVQSETTVYFYLYDLDFEAERLVTRCACWVKNLCEAPDELDIEEIEDDVTPLLPKAYISESMDMEPFKEEDLEIVWSSEGNIAGLYHKDILVCAIPSWAVPTQMPGYSLYCKENNTLAWQLEEDSEMLTRLDAGRLFWIQDFQESWMSYSNEYLLDLEKHYGEAKQCLRVNQGAFPTFFIMVYEKDDISYAYSAGMGMFPLPNTELYFDDYEKRNRCEIAFSWKTEDLSESDLDQIFAQMSGLINIPWRIMDYIGHGHTIDFQIYNDEYAIFLRNEKLEDSLKLAVEPDISINWIVPISKDQFVEMQTSKSNVNIMKDIQEHKKFIYRKNIGER